MPFKFEKLDIWKQALELSDQINELAKQFPAYEIYNIDNLNAKGRKESREGSQRLDQNLFGLDQNFSHLIFF
jgi:hypothetical protein